MYSMTAFARASSIVFERSLVWEVRSVNHRYLEHHFRLPDAARGLEGTLREVLRKQLTRGKLDCSLRMEQDPGQHQLKLNSKRLDEVLALVRRVEERSGDLAKANAIDILRWPGLLEDDEADEDALQKAIVSLFENSIDALIEARKSEGERLKALIEHRLDQIDQIVAELKPLCADLAQIQKQRLQQRVQELSVELDDGRLEQEVALLAQKADVTEELDRLTIHVAEAREHIVSTGPHGRRLDFLTQELNREANTLGAKSILAETSQRAVGLKVIIEQIREQVQNIE